MTDIRASGSGPKIVRMETETLITKLTPESRTTIHSSLEKYEELVQQLSKGNNPELFTFPLDDIEIVETPKISATAEPSITNDVITCSRGTTVEPMIDLLTKPYRVVKRNYAQYGGHQALPTYKEQDPIPENDWPHSDVETAQPIFLDITILRPYNPEDNARDHAKRQENRVDVFSNFPFKRAENETPPDSRILMDQFHAHIKTTRLFVECKKFDLSVGCFEPFFFHATLYDITKKCRISETWSFEKNDPSILSLLGAKAIKHPITSATQAIFDVVTASPDIYLIIRVEKLLRGVELDQSLEPYTKDQIKPKEKDKILKELGQTVSRLGDYYQPFGWGAVQLFNDAGQLLVGDLTQIKVIRARADDTEALYLDTLKKRHGRDKKITALPIDFVFNFKVNPDEKMIQNLVSPSLLSVYKPLFDGDIVRQMQTFYGEAEFLQPQFELVHNLYIYPESVNFTKHKDPNNSRNITVKTRIKNSDQDPLGEGQAVIYGGAIGAPMRVQALTPVVYHKKTPSFMEEIKVKLPVKLSPTDHIMFMFAHVVCQAKGKSVPVENLLGFVAIPLFADQKILEDQRFSVPIAATIVPSYLSPEAEANIKWIDHKRPLFSFRTKLISTIYTQDDNLNEFFKLSMNPSSESKQLTMGIRKLLTVDQKAYAQFYAVVLNMLITIMCTRPDAIAREAVLALLHVLDNVKKLPNQSSRVNFLRFYVDYQFDNIKGAERMPYFAILKYWDSMLEVKCEQNQQFHEHSWFLFELIIKSMTLHLADSNLLNSRDIKKVEFFGKECEGMVKNLIRQVGTVVIEGAGNQSALSKNTALFLKDLFPLLNRGFVLSLIGSFIGRLDPRNVIMKLVSCKFTALKILCCYEHFVQLNVPVIDEIHSTATIMPDFWAKHYLIGLLLDETSNCLSSADTSARMKAIMTLRDVLWKLSVASDTTTKELVASMFFPFILIALERVDTVAKGDKKEISEWAVCFLFVLKYCSHEALLRKWWRNDTLKHHRSFLNFLSIIVQSVDHAPLLRELSFSVLDAIEEFIADMESELLSPESALMEYVFAVFIRLLEQNQTASFLSSIFLSLRRFVMKFQQMFFVWPDTVAYCSELCFHVLRYTNSAHPVTRSEAGSLLYLMVKLNYQLRNNFMRVKLQSTIAVSRLCGETNLKEFSNLEKCLTNVSRLAKKEFEQKFNNQEMGNDIEDLIGRLFKIIRDSIKISEYSFDPEMIADLTYGVSIGYKDSPDLRVAWLGNLLRFHTEQGNYEEVAQCKFLICALVIEALNTSGGSVAAGVGGARGIPKSKHELLPICPNISREKGLPPVSGAQDEGLYNTATFSEAGLIDALDIASENLIRAQRFETSIDMHNILLEIYQTRKDYQKLSVCFDKLKSISEALVETDKSTGRLFNNFYRVGFYGHAFQELHEQEFVYKQGAMVRLAEFTERLKQQYSRYGPVTILPNTPVDQSKLTLDKNVYLQIVAVDPYFGTAEGNGAAENADAQNNTRKTEWDRNFNVNQFIYETPFTTTGDSHGDLSVQCKRKHVLSTDISFPYVKKRLLVKRKHEIILSPIENAIEIIQMREQALRREMNQTPPNGKTLQIQLQGAVLTQVNAGPIEIATTFLGEKAAQYDSTQVALLCHHLQQFVKICGFAVVLNKTLIKPDQIQFQKECELGAANLKNLVEQIISQTPQTPTT